VTEPRQFDAKALAKARTYLLDEGRPLDAALYAFHHG
jgi:hypothetical protein